MKTLSVTGTSDKYAEMMGLDVEGNTHDPLYDCRVAAKVYFDVINK